MRIMNANVNNEAEKSGLCTKKKEDMACGGKATLWKVGFGPIIIEGREWTLKFSDD